MESDAEIDYQKLVIQQNKKNKSGGFQSMGLSQPVFRGIIKKGYKIPTPIQRKCIPVIMDGRDVVAMARTGSGKTAAFLIPLLERLKTRSAKAGARALILSPTRELALQTFKFVKELGKFTGLKATVILGGNKMDDQFAAIHENPDIIIATPGRFLHVVMEMDLKLSSVEYVVFDEADRLFEMGFAEQLREVLKRLPEDNRQTTLFSATLPHMLADFARAGLSDPILIRLDVDSKISDDLQLMFLSCRSEDKIAILLHLLKCVISPKELTFIFVATRHHVEYLSLVLNEANIKCTQLYSNLDQTARKINITKFQARQVPVMIVTDVAARGIDIPMLDVVINLAFPPKPKLFVHRVGRVARAGRTGTAYSLISPDEVPYVLDLHLFLGKSINYATEKLRVKDSSGVFGTVPRSIIEEEEEQLLQYHEKNLDLQNMQRVCENAYKQYLKSRPSAAAESIRRIKDDLKTINVGVHPLFGNLKDRDSSSTNILDQIRNFKAPSTIFEVNSTTKTSATQVMRTVRKKYSKAIESHRQKMNEKILNVEAESHVMRNDEDQDYENIDSLFSETITSKKRKLSNVSKLKVKKKKKASVSKSIDPEFFIAHQPKDHHSEKGLEIEKNFEMQVSNAVLDFTGDDVRSLKQNKQQMKWDRKKKKFVHESGKEKGNVRKIKTESGTWIPATYKSDLYKKWKQKNKINEMLDSSNDENDEEDSGGKANKKRNIKFHPAKRFLKNGKMMGRSNPPKRELRNKEEILKQRKRKQNIQFQQKRRQMRHSRNKTKTNKKR